MRSAPALPSPPARQREPIRRRRLARPGAVDRAAVAGEQLHHSLGRSPSAASGGVIDGGERRCRGRWSSPRASDCERVCAQDVVQFEAGMLRRCVSTIYAGVAPDCCARHHPCVCCPKSARSPAITPCSRSISSAARALHRESLLVDEVSCGRACVVRGRGWSAACLRFRCCFEHCREDAR